MTQPICNFVQEYAHENILRLHMPGHKGKRMLGPEALDITELTPGELDPQYKFNDLSEIQAYARARIKELDQPALDKKQKRSR